MDPSLEIENNTRLRYIKKEEKELHNDLKYARLAFLALNAIMLLNGDYWYVQLPYALSIFLICVSYFCAIDTHNSKLINLCYSKKDCSELDLNNNCNEFGTLTISIVVTFIGLILTIIF